jgi:ribonuclease P protein component
VFCFEKTRRLLKKSEFDYVFKNPQKILTTEFIVLYRPNITGHARLGMALSKKTIPKAHDRNRLKRLLRETFRTTCLPAIDIVVLSRLGAAKQQNSILINKLSRVWGKLATFCGK